MEHSEILSPQNTILLVEDLHRSGFRFLPRYWLRDHGYCVLEATNGLEALHRARTHRGPIDLLIAEIDLPFMQGRELAAHIRSLFPGVKIVFVVSETSPIPPSSPSAEFLQKPLHCQTILKKIRNLMGKGVERLHATA